jgi:hypothetical protein
MEAFEGFPEGGVYGDLNTGFSSVFFTLTCEETFAKWLLSSAARRKRGAKKKSAAVMPAILINFAGIINSALGNKETIEKPSLKKRGFQNGVS